MLRRVELNGRSGDDGENPWSIRQTAVYHKLAYDADSADSRSTFLLIAPSENVKFQFHECLEKGIVNETTRLSCWNEHTQNLVRR